MHKLKKLFHTVAPTTSADGAVAHDAVCEDLKNKLEMVHVALINTEAIINSTEKAWKEIISAEVKVGESLATRYPDPDDVRDTAKMFNESFHEMQKEMRTRSDKEVDYHTIAKKVTAYLAQIKAMSAEYKRLEDARVEYEMYNQKLVTLQKEHDKKGEKLDEKLHRNEDKHANAKQAYESVLNDVVTKQQNLLHKQEEAYRAAFTAYFLLQAHMLDAMDKHGKPVYAYGAKHEQELLDFQFQNLSV